MTGTKVGRQAGKYRPRPAPEDPNEHFRERAHARIDELFDSAKRGGFYGEVGLSVVFENGNAQRIKRRLEGTDK